MKLIYQWLIILALSGILWALHTYGGAGCSKPLPSRPYIPPLKIVVQRRSSVVEQTDSGIQEDTVPAVPQTPPSKNKKRRENSAKRRIRRKTAKIRKPTDDISEWDLCDSSEKMIQ